MQHYDFVTHPKLRSVAYSKPCTRDSHKCLQHLLKNCKQNTRSMFQLKSESSVSNNPIKILSEILNLVNYKDSPIK